MPSSDKDNETMECISGMIRYGYQESIDEIRILVDKFFKVNNSALLHSINDKLNQMESNKHKINLEKLQKECNI